MSDKVQKAFAKLARAKCRARGARTDGARRRGQYQVRKAAREFDRAFKAAWAEDRRRRAAGDPGPALSFGREVSHAG